MKLKLSNILNESKEEAHQRVVNHVLRSTLDKWGQRFEGAIRPHRMNPDHLMAKLKDLEGEVIEWERFADDPSGIPNTSAQMKFLSRNPQLMGHIATSMRQKWASQMHVAQRDRRAQSGVKTKRTNIRGIQRYLEPNE